MFITEKRKFTRVPFRTLVKLKAAGRTIISQKLRDISLGGAFLYSTEAFPVGTMCLLEIRLTGRASLLKIGVEGKVVRAEDGGLAVEFSRIDVDSLVHLRHIVKIYSQDPETVEIEFNRKLLEIE